MHRSSCCRWYLNIIHEQTKRSVLLWTGSSWRARREGRGGPTWNCWTCRRTRRTRRRRAQRKPSMRTGHTRTYTDCHTDQWPPISLLCLIIDLFVLISGSCWFPWWSRPPWWGWTQSKCRFWMIHVYLFAEMLNVAPQLPTVQFSLFTARLSFVLNRTTQRKPLTSSSLFLGPGWCQGRERRGRRSRRTCE